MAMLQMVYFKVPLGGGEECIVLQWIPVNRDVSGLEYFAPVKRLPQIYEVARYKVGT
jgi:hypothetical protein